MDGRISAAIDAYKAVVKAQLLLDRKNAASTVAAYHVGMGLTRGEITDAEYADYLRITDLIREESAAKRGKAGLPA